MGEMKPTPGEWRAKQLGGYENPGWVILWPDKGGAHMRRIDYQGNFTESDSRLIAEAGTVFHNTGLSPVQLVELVKELRAALCLMVRTHDEPAESLLQEVKEQQWLDRARAALAKCEGVK